MLTKKIVISLFFLCVIIGIGYPTYKRVRFFYTAQFSTISAKAEFETKKWEKKTATIDRNDTAIFYVTIVSIVFLVGSAGFSSLVLFTGKHRAMVRNSSVFVAKIGKHSEIPVKYEDLGNSWPVMGALAGAEQMKHYAEHTEEAYQKTRDLVEVQTQYIKAMSSHSRKPATAIDTPVEPLALSAGNVPTFGELLQSGRLAPGKPMILGYENGVPREGSFLDIYSAAVAGETGSGKTSTMLFLIGSGLVAENARFLGIDPHYPHPNSLGYKVKPLCDAGLMQMATFKDDMVAMLQQVEHTIDNRLRQTDTDTTPVVLVIDELAFLSKTSIGSQVAYTMERVSTEGRKCAVYMLASSQTWLASRTGGDSVVRDTLTSAYVHRIKPRQAQILLQDKDEKDKVKRCVKQAGEALLLPIGNESVVVRMPYTTEDDMLTLAKMLVVVPQAIPMQAQHVQAMTPELLTIELIKEMVGKNATFTTQKSLAEALEISESYLTKLFTGERGLSDALAQKTCTLLQHA